MSGFTITITDAGRAALINAQNTGTNAFVLSQIGVSTQHVTADLAALTTLPDERKRLGTMAGDVVSDDTLHVTIRDEGNDAYPMRAFGLYTSTGILFAVYSQPDPIIEKSAAAMLLLAVDAKLVALSTDQVEFGPVGFTLPPASETVAGITEVATDAEADAGTDNWRYITPRLLKRALAALSGFALLGHKHDAGDTTSGVFNIGRIPALGMDKITGLANALAGKAAEAHTHTLAQVTGLVDALAAKAALAHQHHANDIAQGVLAVARIPDLAMSKISGLVAALGSKADLQHSHDAGDTTSGTFNVGRIPALAMEKITGLAVALSNKADAAVAFVMRGSLGSVNSPNSSLTQGAYRQSTNANAQIADGYPIANDGGTLLVYNPGADTGLQTYHGRSSGRFWSRPFLSGNFSPWVEHWTTGNFDPGNYATTAHVANAIAAIPATPNATTSVRGLALLATNAQTQAGTDASRSMTPAGLWSFAKSIGPSGYVQIPGTDLIIQWGGSTANLAEGQVSATLPVAFGGGCLAAMAICSNPTSNTGNDFWMQVVGKYLNRIVFLANRSGTGGTVSGYEWMAIGLAKGTPDPANSGGGGGGEFPPGDGDNQPVIP